MKTFQEFYNEIYTQDLVEENITLVSIEERAAKKYAEQMVKEQRDLMATYLATHFNMRNIPKPKFE